MEIPLDIWKIICGMIDNARDFNSFARTCKLFSSAAKDSVEIKEEIFPNMRDVGNINACAKYFSTTSHCIEIKMGRQGAPASRFIIRGQFSRYPYYGPWVTKLGVIAHSSKNWRKIEFFRTGSHGTYLKIYITHGEPLFILGNDWGTTTRNSSCRVASDARMTISG